MGWHRRPGSGRHRKSFLRAVGSMARVGVCLVVGVSSAAAGPIGLHTSDLDVADLYAGEVVDAPAVDRDAREAFPALAGLRFSAIDVINPDLDASDVTHQAQDQIQEWTGAHSGPFDSNVTLAALVSGSISVPEAVPQTEIVPLAMEPGSSVAPTRGPLQPEALASVMPPTLAGVVSPSLFTPPAAPPPAGPAPQPPASVEEGLPRSGPSLLTVAAIAALVVIGATTIAMQSERSHRRRRRHRTQRDF